MVLYHSFSKALSLEVTSNRVCRHGRSDGIQSDSTKGDEGPMYGAR